jgi:hypothetical protein
VLIGNLGQKARNKKSLSSVIFSLFLFFFFYFIFILQLERTLHSTQFGKMEIISSNDGILCNAEVMSIIKDRQHGDKTSGSPVFQNREVLEMQLASKLVNELVYLCSCSPSFF